MPISTANSYIPTMQEFATHWNAANTTLGATPLTLKGGYTVATLVADRAALQAAITAVEDKNNARQTAANNRDTKKAALYPRVGQFRAAVQHLLNGSVYVQALPLAPDIKRAEGVFLRSFDDMATLWARINADATIAGFTPPLLLVGGYNKATFDAELAALRTAYASVKTAETDAALARKRRDALLPPARQRMTQYKTAVLAKFGATDPLTLSLPKYSPDAGSTPDPVNLSVLWEPTQTKARLVWASSTNPKLDHYEVRQSGAATYKAAEEFAVASVPKTATELLTGVGLVAPGAVNSFKVYVVTTDGNEKGSNAVKVSRPLV